MYSYTTFTHPTLINKIVKAAEQSKNISRPVYVDSQKGRVAFRVSMLRNADTGLYELRIYGRNCQKSLDKMFWKGYSYSVNKKYGE